jgi:hypothetical protein
MTWNNPPKFKHDPKKGPAKVILPEDLAGNSEHSQQVALFAWAALNVGKYPSLKWLHSIPNGGLRDIRTATNLKAEGVKAGILDIFLPLPIQTEWAEQYAGLYIELKTEKRRNQKNGGMSEEQIEFMLYCGAIGYFAKVCYGWEEARDIIIEYLECRI